MRLKLIIAGIIILIAAAVYRLSQTAQIEITVTDTSGEGSYTYLLTNQKTGKSSTSIGSSNSYRTFVDVATYDVQVTRGNHSLVTYTTTKGFLVTSKLSGTLQAERERTFVGSGPGECKNIISGLLVSDDCNGRSDISDIFVPSTATRPGYIQPLVGLNGRVEASLSFADDTSLVLTQPATDRKADPATMYRLKLTGSTLQVVESQPVPDVSKSLDHRIISYKTGFIVYADDFSEILYYANLRATPQKITLEKPSNELLKAKTMSANAQGDILASYIEDSETEGDATNAEATEIAVISNGKTTRYQFAKYLSDFQYCGTGLLCDIDQFSQLFEIRQADQPDKILATYKGAVEIIASGPGHVYMMRLNDILHIDPTTHEAYIAYNFTGFGSCGLLPVPNGIGICITGITDNAQVLRLTNDQATSTAIDKQVKELTKKTDDIETVSIQGKNLFIVPKGTLIKNWDTRSLEPDPVKQAAITARINQYIDEIGISRQNYQIVISSPIDI